MAKITHLLHTFICQVDALEIWSTPFSVSQTRKLRLTEDLPFLA